MNLLELALAIEADVKLLITELAAAEIGPEPGLGGMGAVNPFGPESREKCERELGEAGFPGFTLTTDHLRAAVNDARVATRKAEEAARWAEKAASPLKKLSAFALPEGESVAAVFNDGGTGHITLVGTSGSVYRLRWQIDAHDKRGWRWVPERMLRYTGDYPEAP